MKSSDANSFSFLLLLYITLIPKTLTSSMGFRSAFPSWPSYCCPLQLTEILFGTSLPRDAIIAGTVQGKKWGYAVDQTDEFIPMFMSEDYRERPVRGSPTHHCSTEATKTTYEVLTNPFKCQVNWYQTRYENENFVNQSGVIVEGNGFMPAFNGYFFAKISNTMYGDLPAVSYNGVAYGCRNDTFDVMTTGNGYEVLFVDCLQSLKTMASARLVNVSSDEDDLMKMMDNTVTYFNRTYRNNFNESKKQAVAFHAMRVNSVMGFVEESLVPSFGANCDNDRKITFADMFNVKILDPTSIIMSSWLMRVSNKLGIDVRKGMANMQATTCNKHESNSDKNTTFHRETQTYKYSDDILIPANSVTTMTASTKVTNGIMRFNMTYELFPVIPDLSEVLFNSLHHFQLANDISISDRGTILVTFHGQLIVDSAYEIMINTVSLPIGGESKEPIFTTSQSLFPVHEVKNGKRPESSGMRMQEGDQHSSPFLSSLPAGLSTMTCLVH